MTHSDVVILRIFDFDCLFFHFFFLRLISRVFTFYVTNNRKRNGRSGAVEQETIGPLGRTHIETVLVHHFTGRQHSLLDIDVEFPVLFGRIHSR